MTDAHAVLLQETKLLADDIEEASDWSTKNGWHPTFGPAVKTDRSVSSGTAILTRDSIGTYWPGTDGEPCGTATASARFTAVVIQPPGICPIILVSVYLQVGAGLNPANMQVLADIGNLVTGLQLPYIIGGDFNLVPAALTASGLLARIRATLVKTPKATCVTSRPRSVIDFFLVADDLSQAIAAIDIEDRVIVSPHRAILLTFAVDMDKALKTVLKVQPRIPHQDLGPYCPGTRMSPPWRPPLARPMASPAARSWAPPQHRQPLTPPM